jgi:hypothetical protein
LAFVFRCLLMLLFEIGQNPPSPHIINTTE